MKQIRNQDGIALLTALMFTFICLTMILGLLYMVTQGIQASGSMKRYKTAREASYGGAEIALKDAIPFVLQGDYTSEPASFNAVNLQFPNSTTCLKEKLQLPTSLWSTSCSNTTLDPKTSPDMTMELQSSGAGSAPYSVYAKIVDTIKGNTDISGRDLDGAGVVEGGAWISPQHFPIVYRVEVEAEKKSATAAKEKGSLSIQYAY